MTAADKLAEALRNVIRHCDGDTIEGLYALSDAREALAAYEREKAVKIPRGRWIDGKYYCCFHNFINEGHSEKCPNRQPTHGGQKP